MIKLYAGSGSPFAWRVWLTLEEKHLAYELHMLSFSAREHKTPEYLALNPRGKVPTLVDGDFALYESAAIVEYLDETHPEHPLFGATPRARAQVRRLVREMDSYLGEAMEVFVRQYFRRAEAERDQAVIAAARAEVRHELDYYEGLLDGEWLAGTPSPSAADLSLYPMLALLRRLESRHPGAEVMAGVGPRVAAWMGRVEALPYFAKTVPPHWKES